MKKYFDKNEIRSIEERKSAQDRHLASMLKIGYKKSGMLKIILDSQEINPAKIKQEKIWKLCLLFHGKN